MAGCHHVSIRRTFSRGAKNNRLLEGLVCLDECYLMFEKYCVAACCSWRWGEDIVQGNIYTSVNMWGGFERRSGIWRDEGVTRAQNESRT